MKQTALQAKEIYAIVGVGNDCDGFSRSNNCLPVYYSKSVAEKIADASNAFSDGIISIVVPASEASRYSQRGNPSFSYVGI